MRLLIVALFMCSVAGIISIVALFPAFIHAIFQESDQLHQIALVSSQKSDSSISMAKNELALTKNISDALEKEIHVTPVSQVIEKISAVRGNSSIVSLSVVRNTATSFTLVIQGLAPTRDALIALKSRIESSVPNSKVDLPIDELIQTKDIQYLLKIYLN